MSSLPTIHRRLLARHLLAVLVTAAVTLPLWLLRDTLTLANFSVIYILTTLIIAIALGTGPSLLAAALAFFCFNFFLIRPFYTLAVQDPRELLDLVVFLIVAVIAGQLAAYARRQAEAAHLRTAEQDVLLKLTSAFNQVTGREGVYATLRRVLRDDFAVTHLALLPGPNDDQVPADPAALFLLLQAGETIYGTLRLSFATPPADPSLRLLTACANQAAMALQRIDLSERAQRILTLEEADRLKTALLHAVSHDLRTPITIIKSSAGNLRALHDRLSASDRLEMVSAIEGEIDLLDKMVGELLDMSRLEAGALVLNRDWHALSEIAGDAAARAWQLGQTERVRLDFPDDLPLVRCDYGLLLQALYNVVENVLRYEPPGSQVLLSGARHGRELWLAVVNHGSTVPDDEKERIMEPFYHGQGGQIGLGLAIARGLVEAHQGRLWVEDTAGGGATFIMALPLADGAEETPHAPSGG